MEIGTPIMSSFGKAHKTKHALVVLGINLFKPQPTTIAQALKQKRTPKLWMRDDLRYILVDAKANHRRLSQEYHPDRGGAHEKMIQINQAWDYVQRSFARKGITL